MERIRIIRKKEIRRIRTGGQSTNRIFRGNRDGSWDQKRCYKNTRFYCSTCSDKNQKFYHCHGFYRINSETRTCFLEHQHYMSQFFFWLLCFSPLYYLLYLLNSFCACFLPITLITPFNILYVWSDWLFDLVFLIFLMHMMTPRSKIYSVLTIYMPITGYQRWEWSDAKKSPLINKPIDFYNKKVIVLKDIFMLLPYYDYFFNEFSNICISTDSTSLSRVQNIKYLRWIY